MGKNVLQICYIASGVHPQMMPKETYGTFSEDFRNGDWSFLGI